MGHELEVYEFSYSISSNIPAGLLDIRALNDELDVPAALSGVIDGVLWDGESDEFQILSTSETLTAEQLSEIDSVLSNHAGDQLKNIRKIVTNAIVFFQEIMITYASENVAMGITQVGKTKDVADYLSNVMRYGQSGSLYEVMSEIATLKAAGVPVDLAPFVTNDRLDGFNAKIASYLGV